MTLSAIVFYSALEVLLTDDTKKVEQDDLTMYTN